MKPETAEFYLRKLQTRLAELGPVAVAVSGGVDSMTLAVVANRVNAATEMFHAVSPAVPLAATERVQRYARLENWRLHIVNAREVEDKDYRKNPVNRCYFCKTNLYSTLAIESNLTIVSGTNLDDLGDYRPGLEAAREHQVVHPFVDAGIDKQTLRAIAKRLGLTDLHELPAAPCLASRVTTGIEIDEKLLPVIDRVETVIWREFGEIFSLSAVRCRILPDKISIQLQGEVDFQNSDIPFALIQNAVKIIFNEAGYHRFQHISIDPYQRGSAFLVSEIKAINL